MTGPRDAFFLFFSDEFRQSCINIQITQDSLLEIEEQFSLRFIELEGTSLPDNLVLNPQTSTIRINLGDATAILPALVRAWDLQMLRIAVSAVQGRTLVMKQLASSA